MGLAEAAASVIRWICIRAKRSSDKRRQTVLKGRENQRGGLVSEPALRNVSTRFICIGTSAMALVALYAK